MSAPERHLPRVGSPVWPEPGTGSCLPVVPSRCLSARSTLYLIPWGSGRMLRVTAAAENHGHWVNREELFLCQRPEPKRASVSEPAGCCPATWLCCPLACPPPYLPERLPRPLFSRIRRGPPGIHQRISCVHARVKLISAMPAVLTDHRYALASCRLFTLHSSLGFSQSYFIFRLPVTRLQFRWWHRSHKMPKQE